MPQPCGESLVYGWHGVNDLPVTPPRMCRRLSNSASPIRKLTSKRLCGNSYHCMNERALLNNSPWPAVLTGVDPAPPQGEPQEMFSFHDPVQDHPRPPWPWSRFHDPQILVGGSCRHRLASRPRIDPDNPEGKGEISAHLKSLRSY